MAILQFYGTVDSLSGQDFSLRIFGYLKSLEKELPREEDSVDEAEEPEEPRKPLQKNLRKKYIKFRKYFGIAEVKKVLRLVPDQIWHFLHIKQPEVAVVFGVGEPHKTGLIMGLIHSSGILRKINGTITPDFLAETMYGNVRFRGWIIPGEIIGRLVLIVFTVISLGIRHRIGVIFYSSRQKGISAT
ncbi:MAG: hypothetical protein K9N46_02810 [Candidatus Marinimicrobia bacterium]|nr:hypothetical protein [Candidatus Neomarinimicrobiota bacterium]MCF7828172.1 hypothetical protein [Candidatus Neomarinimicrobiota bacterium]MCF7879653.1 hypothetical protein [Candidatus Neomarinimicrobiota bacterium]